MAQGVLGLSAADISVAVSGIAGPDGGSEEKPLGTVCFAWSTRQNGKIETDVLRRQLDGDREDVRSESVLIPLQGLRERLVHISADAMA